MFPCSEASGCIQLQEFNRYIVFSIYGHPNIDVKNFDRPVTPLLNTDTNFYINPGAGKGYDIQYQEVEVETESQQSIQGAMENIITFDPTIKFKDSQYRDPSIIQCT